MEQAVESISSDYAITSGAARRATATALSSVLPGVGQLLLGKTRMGIVFICTFAFLGFLYRPVRLPHFYFGLQLLMFATMALCIASAWHALRSPAERVFQASRWWFVLVLPIALVASFAHSSWLLLAAGFRPFDVPSSGMERTIHQGDRVLVDLKQYRNERPRRGDVVIFRKEGTFFVKRVMAIGGDTVQGKDGAVMLNNQSLEEPYATHVGNPPDQLNTFGPVAIAPGAIFVMGDNRDVSRDSRMADFGLVANASVSGRCLYVLSSKSGKVVLPHLASIGGFVLLFVAVTALAAWFMTSSPRLSYFGMQIAVAFYLINLSEFRMQTSLEVARDRVVGIFLGLFAMWLIFDQLWGMPAARELKETFISNLRLLGEFAREPVSMDPEVATARRFALGETINANLDKARALADGVLFEFGRSREQDLALRSLIRRAQPQIRLLFIMQIAEWKYRAQLPGFELPEAIAVQQREFDDRLAESLDAMAARMEGQSKSTHQKLQEARSRLELTIQAYRPTGTSEERFDALLFLSHKLESSIMSLTNEI